MNLNLRRTAKWLDENLAIVFLLPGIFIIVVLMIYPITITIKNSFTDMSFLRPEIAQFIGLKNYKWAVDEQVFWNAVKVSVLWTIGTVSFQMIVGMISALAMDRISRFISLFRLGLLLPWAFPSISVALTWKWLFDTRFGIVNSFLISIGVIDERIAWLSHPDLAFPVVILMGIWFGFPFMMLTFLAGLQTIPQDFYDVARIEGANYFQQFIKIILPSLKRIIGIVLVLRTIWMFNNFDLVFLSTGGGPGVHTQTIPIFAYNITWRELSLGKGSAVNVVLLLILVVFIIVYFKVLGIQKDE